MVVREPSGGVMGATGSQGTQWTVRRVLDWTADYLRRGDVESARFEAESLLAHALRTERLELYLQPGRPLDVEERGRFRSLVQQRRAGTPLGYLLGTTPFRDARLRVDRSVLIPRAETEELVDWIIRKETAPAGGDRYHVLDLGIGSGAIAIALALQWPHARFVGVDRSPEALRLARENAHDNGVADRVALLCADWCQAIRGTFDLIVSNPPYVPTEAYRHLPTEVRAHEPRRALDGGARGTREIERIIRSVPRCLRAGGKLYLEIDAHQAEEVSALLERTGALSPAEVRHDIRGQDRMVRAIAATPEGGPAKGN